MAGGEKGACLALLADCTEIEYFLPFSSLRRRRLSLNEREGNEVLSAGEQLLARTSRAEKPQPVSAEGGLQGS